MLWSGNIHVDRDGEIIINYINQRGGGLVSIRLRKGALGIWVG